MALARDVAEEFEHLAQWLPAIEGVSPSFDNGIVPPTTDTLERDGKTVRKRRQAPIEFTAIPKCQEPSFEPRCVIEEYPEELSRAVRTLRKLETLLSDTRTRQHAIVLVVAYLSLGSEARKRLDSRGGVGLFVGLVCMPFEDQRAIEKFDRRKEQAVLQQGNYLLDEARTAWANLPPNADRAVNGRGRVRLSEVRDTIDKVVSNAMRILLHGKLEEKTRMVTSQKTLRAVDCTPIIEGVEFYNVRDVARITGHAWETIHNMVAQGKIPATMRENRYFVPASWVRSLEQPVPPANSSELESSQSTESRSDESHDPQTSTT